jgi:hypothetical protein
MDADVIVVGAGLASLVATHELTRRGKKVALVDQETRRTLVGKHFGRSGGIFLVNSPEQRRMRVKDSVELAWSDWQGSAAFGRLDDEDIWARRPDTGHPQLPSVSGRPHRTHRRTAPHPRPRGRAAHRCQTARPDPKNAGRHSNRPCLPRPRRRRPTHPRSLRGGRSRGLWRWRRARLQRPGRHFPRRMHLLRSRRWMLASRYHLTGRRALVTT